MWRSMVLAVALGLALPGLALAQGTEVTLPDGQNVILYNDHTWEFKRPPPQPMADTVGVDELVGNPGRYVDQDVVVSGKVARLLGAYRLLSNTAQNNLVLDVREARRADQIALDQALTKVGFGNSVTVQAHGLVEQSLTTSRLVATDLILIDK